MEKFLLLLLFVFLLCCWLLVKSLGDVFSDEEVKEEIEVRSVHDTTCHEEEFWFHTCTRNLVVVEVNPVNVQSSTNDHLRDLSDGQKLVP